MFGQKSIVMYLARKGLNTTAIRHETFATLALDALSYPTVTRLLRERLFARDQLPAQEPVVEPDPSTIDLASGGQAMRVG
jgi:hypothetical protein